MSAEREARLAYCVLGIATGVLRKLQGLVLSTLSEIRIRVDFLDHISYTIPTSQYAILNTHDGPH